MALRHYLVVLAALLGAAACILTLAAVGTPEVTRWAVTLGKAAVGSDAAGLCLCGAAVALLCAIGMRCAEVLRRPEIDTTPLMDDCSRGPLPEEWHEPNVIEFTPRDAA